MFRKGKPLPSWLKRWFELSKRAAGTGTFERYARSSVVTGPYGSGAEYGGGFNWYLNKSRQSRFTFETLYIDGSPAQNFLYPYRAGFTGTAIQTQYMAVF